MNQVLCIAELSSGKLSLSIYNLVQAALKLSPSVHVVLLGSKLEAVTQQAALIAGVTEVHVMDAPHLASLTGEDVLKALQPLLGAYSHVLAPSSTFGKNILPRLAAFLGLSAVSDLCGIHEAKKFDRPAFAGNIIETVESLEPQIFATVRTASFDPVGHKESPALIQVHQVPLKDERLEVLKVAEVLQDKPDLSSAARVVSGGRGLGSAENFILIEKLAEKLGAAVGASRAAVDAGFVPNDYQVGQTGKIIAPALYVAVGISGAIQHVAGMKDSKVIVAINKDPDAPIFDIATYALVGDLFSILPELTAKI